MSEGLSPQSVQQQKVSEFLRLLPLTLEIAGLGKCEPAKNFTEGQLEARVLTIKAAYKLARTLVMEVASK